MIHDNAVAADQFDSLGGEGYAVLKASDGGPEVLAGHVLHLYHSSTSLDFSIRDPHSTIRNTMNVLFLLLDTVRRDFLSCYGNNWVQTPNLAKLARRGVTFDNHYIGSMPCMPARRELTTGRYNFLHRGWGPVEPYDDALPRWLREKKGVFSTLLTDHDHYFELGGENYHTAYTTWEFFRGQEHDPWASHVDALALPEGYNPIRQNDPKLPLNYGNRLRQQREEDFSGPRTCRAAIDWLEANRNAKGEWFLQVELFDPHEPFYTTKKYLEMYGADTNRPAFDWPPYAYTDLPPGDVEHLRKCYAALLTMTDHWAGKVLAKLEEIGQFDDTLIVFTSDHGSMLGEGTAWLKNYMPLYNPIAHIPLVMKLPGGQGAGQRRSGFTQNIDLMPTFCDYFGVTPPPHVQGQSLRPMAERGEPARRDGIFGYFGLAINIADGRHVYMRMPTCEDLGPLNAYTAMPIAGLNRWFDRDTHACTETGRYFNHTYDLPLYKIPVRGGCVRSRHGEESYRGRHLLFDVQADPQQQSPIHDPAAERRMIERMVHHMQASEAPPEQYQRVGLEAYLATAP
jgi:arylsulfatase A-like enzyme